MKSTNTLLAIVAGLGLAFGSMASARDIYYVNDHLATTVAVIDDVAGEIAQLEADAFGSPMSHDGRIGNPTRYTGKPYDEDLGAYVFPFRNYRSEEGRWMSADPSGFPDGTNGHFYAPHLFTEIDTFGLDIIIIIGDRREGSLNIFGHAAGASTGNGVFSPGTDHPAGSSVTDYLTEQAKSRNQTTYTLPTDSATDDAFAKIMEHMLTGLPNPYTDPIDAWEDNCASRLGMILHDVGIDIGNINTPGDLAKALQTLVDQGKATKDTINKGGKPGNGYGKYNRE